MSKLYFGIDPGLKGGLAAVGDAYCIAMPMPIIKGTKRGSKSMIDIGAVRDWVVSTALSYVRETPIFCGGLMSVQAVGTSGIPPIGNQFFLAMGAVTIEKVGTMPKQGVTSSFNFGRGYGMLEGMCTTLCFPTQLVRPQAWKKLVLAGTQKDKSAAIQFVKRQYPGVRLRATDRCTTDHDGMADAICLAEYGRRIACE